ncbi:MAG TPA: hypothetical protein VJB12_03455 [Candidatus Nanoarchaeia archaeon]|nr:hypothetical protein [Candidatus Nanoarchaeia archaeon]
MSIDEKTGVAGKILNGLSAVAASIGGAIAAGAIVALIPATAMVSGAENENYRRANSAIMQFDPSLGQSNFKMNLQYQNGVLLVQANGSCLALHAQPDQEKYPLGRYFKDIKVYHITNVEKLSACP